MYFSDILSHGLKSHSEGRDLAVLQSQDASGARVKSGFMVAADAVDRRAAASGKLGSRSTDRWMPYSAPFIAQLLAQMDDQQR